MHGHGCKLTWVPTFVPMVKEPYGSRLRDVVECSVVEQYKGGDKLKGDCGLWEL